MAPTRKILYFKAKLNQISPKCYRKTQTRPYKRSREYQELRYSCRQNICSTTLRASLCNFGINFSATAGSERLHKQPGGPWSRREVADKRDHNGRMKLLFDQNLSFKLCALLSDLFPDSKPVRQLGLDQSEDRIFGSMPKTTTLCSSRRIRILRTWPLITV